MRYQNSYYNKSLHLSWGWCIIIRATSHNVKSNSHLVFYDNYPSMAITWIIMDNTPRPAPLICLLINLIQAFSKIIIDIWQNLLKYIIFGIVVVFNFMLEHFELVKCPLCSSFCCVLLIFLYGIKGCFLSKIYSLNILLNQHPTRLSFTPYTATTTRTILISLKTQRIYYSTWDTFNQKVSVK